MAMTSEKLMEAAQLEPQDLGEKIVNPDGTDEQQLAQAIAWLDENVLAGAISEISVPFMTATGFATIDTFIDTRFESLENDAKSELKVQGGKLWDFCVRSFGRSEINKSIDSNATEYDKDSDQDRIQGEQRLKKLIAWAAALLTLNATGTISILAGGNATNSQAVPTVFTW